MSEEEQKRTTLSEMREQVEKMSREQAMEATIKSMATYFWAEMSWEHFRAEFLSEGDQEYESARKNNAETLAKFMKAVGEKHPDLKPLLKLND